MYIYIYYKYTYRIICLILWYSLCWHRIISHVWSPLLRFAGLSNMCFTHGQLARIGCNALRPSGDGSVHHSASWVGMSAAEHWSHTVLTRWPPDITWPFVIRLPIQDPVVAMQLTLRRGPAGWTWKIRIDTGKWFSCHLLIWRILKLPRSTMIYQVSMTSTWCTCIHSTDLVNP